MTVTTIFAMTIYAADAFGLNRCCQSPQADVTVLAPGLVLVRNALSEPEQKQLATQAQRLGRRKNGFRKADGTYNADAARGRIYERTTFLPRCFRSLCLRSVAVAMKEDEAMPSCEPSHCLINHYTSTKGLLWHRDIYANDGDDDHPIVNLSVGASCLFGVEDDRGRTRKVHLRSGDALLFGGPQRFAKHAVLKVMLDETPAWMRPEDCCRLSFTFREARSVLGHEAHYREFQTARRWFDETQRKWRPGDALVPVD